MYGGNHMGTGSWLSIVGAVIVLALIVMAIIWLLSSRSGRPTASSTPAGEILDRRLASGEITSEQYDQLRERLDVGPRDERRSATV
jgi:uncharacterized membrane protein